MPKPKLICGIQPTNRLTLGNYLGAIKNIVKIQNDYDCFIFVADLHSITIPLAYQSFNYQEIQEFRWKVVQMYVAAGIDLSKQKVFIQSEIKEHLELFYFLLTHSMLGELKRMTQYKHLVKQFTNPNQTETALVGLLLYPILMAADILIYDSDYVSIGEDQTQHLELCVNIAERINEKYKKNIFKIPKSLNPMGAKAGVKIKDLQDPEKKMSKTSKSYDGVIFLDEDLESIRAKIMKAKTDSLGSISLDKEKQPGIVNLLEIYAGIKEIKVEEAYEELKGESYKTLKEKVAEVVIKEISQIQERQKNINMEEIKKLVEQHNEECRKIAQKKIRDIQDSI